MAPNSWTPTATKTFVPLESNPDVFTALLRELGVVDRGLVFEDVFALDEPGFLPRPALALVAVFPSDRWDAAAAAGAATEASIDGGVSPATGANGSTEETEYTGSGAAEPIMWFRQTIHNACGLYAVLHALANGPAREMLDPHSELVKLFEACIPLAPQKRAAAIEGSALLEKAHSAVAEQGQTAPTDEVEFHYVCFVCGREEQSHGENSDVGASNRRRRKLFLLDGDRVGGPVDTGVSVEEGGDVLDGDALEWVRGWIAKAEGRTEVALMALVDRRADLA